MEARQAVELEKQVRQERPTLGSASTCKARLCFAVSRMLGWRP